MNNKNYVTVTIYDCNLLKNVVWCQVLKVDGIPLTGGSKYGRYPEINYETSK